MENCKSCGACVKCEPCDHCGNCRRCGKRITKKIPAQIPSYPNTGVPYGPFWQIPPVTITSPLPPSGTYTITC